MARQRSAEDKGKERRKEKVKGRRKRLRDRSKENQGKDEKVFVRQAKDGTTTLAILTPAAEEIGEDGTAQRPPTLGQLLGRVRVGTSYLYGFREDKRNLVKTMYPLNYNFYSSYGPSYDSTFANITLEETQLAQTHEKFNNPNNKQFADTIKNVCLEDYTNTFVDHMIDILEGREVKMDVKEEEEVTKDAKDITEIDFASLRSLGAEGIDMSWVDGVQAEYEERIQAELAAGSVQDRLELTAQLLHNLKTCQNSRLSVCQNTNLNQVATPSPTELKLASRVLENLSSIIHNTQPGQLATIPAIRKAMGVNISATDSALATAANLNEVVAES